MRKSDLQPLIDHMYWVNHRLLDAAAALGPERFAEPSSVTTRDLRATLVHELDVEWSWRLDLQGHSAQAGPEAELRPADYPDVETLRARWARDEAAMYAWFDSLTDAALLGDVGSGFSGDSRPLWQYLMHVLTHATQQQADAATLLSLAGRSPGDLDFLDYLRSLRRADG